jgi:hypothetical protein
VQSGSWQTRRPPIGARQQVDWHLAFLVHFSPLGFAQVRLKQMLVQHCLFALHVFPARLHRSSAATSPLPTRDASVAPRRPASSRRRSAPLTRLTSWSNVSASTATTPHRASMWVPRQRRLDRSGAATRVDSEVSELTIHPTATSDIGGFCNTVLRSAAPPRLLKGSQQVGWWGGGTASASTLDSATTPMIQEESWGGKR